MAFAPVNAFGMLGLPSARVGLMKAKRQPPVSKTMLPSIEHALAPKIVKASQKEVKETLENFNIAKENLPWIKLLDPGLRGIDVEFGDVVKVLRRSIITGKEEPCYRVVVP